MPDASLSVMSTSLASPIARQLIDALDEEIHQRYPEDRFEVILTDQDVGGGAGTFLIAYQAGHPVGCGVVRRLHGEVGEIMRMFVAPDRRGAGVGAAILAALEEEAAELGLTELVLETGDRLEESISLYRRHGYEPAEARNPLLGTHAVFMRKRLGA